MSVPQPRTITPYQVITKNLIVSLAEAITLEFKKKGLKSPGIYDVIDYYDKFNQLYKTKTILNKFINIVPERPISEYAA